jgi:hypothetical protein
MIYTFFIVLTARPRGRTKKCRSASKAFFCLMEAYVIDPGTLTGIAAIIIAVTGLLAELRKRR